MKLEAMQKAVEEAKRFIQAADKAEVLESPALRIGWIGGQYSAAVKRSSMELTRALAEMRRS